MAITAQFDADFSQFNTEVGKAEQSLTGLEMSTAQTSTSIAGMGTVTTSTAQTFTAASKSMQQFDSLLGAVGIHVGPAIKGIQELAAGAAAGVGSLGALGVAGLVLGTAMAAWKIGTVIHDLVQKFVDLDGAIASAATKLGLFADVGAAQAAAKADTLAAATQHLREMTGDATATVTDFSKAVEINSQWLDAHKKAAKDAAKANEEWAKAMETVRIAGQDNNAVLQTMSASTIAAAKAALDHGVAMGTVQTAYKLTASQIAAVEAALKSEQEAAKAAAQEEARITAELKTHWDAVLAIRDEALGKDAVEKATQWTEAIFLLGNSVDKLSHEQLVALQAAMTEAMTAMARNGNLTEEQTLQFNDFAAAAAAAEAALRPVVEVTNDLAAAQTAVVATSGAALDALNQVNAAANTWGMHPGGQVPASSGLKQVGDNLGNQYLVNPKTGEVVQNLQRQYGISGFIGWGPPGPPPTVHIDVAGNILGTQNELARLVGEALTYSYQSGGSRLPA